MNARQKMLIHIVIPSGLMLILSTWLCYLALADFTEQENVTASCPTPPNRILAQLGKHDE
ncbi:MAG: hypothetical protein B7Y56_10805 [Gallionellales bacterium 35-53-114]|jgi:hypothetical protein|nr:MAG: hypothetical protein B7Y56_10805 [Gallionellales bacterium 35-53-114]OYZ64888.1 MAG: hypothetical protein B7Y04_03795 [Gallionellales bacterium 24-53-125]OZB07574.1 MAG: hypothetical protein B7X61_13220 [Gallionellales bacterium 39-52-133]